MDEIGVQCLYLNPVFKGEFNHKYATTNYFFIDDDFGTTEDLCELVEKCHQKGIHVVLDGVFNHVGRSFDPFQDLLKNGKASPYRDWFYVAGTWMSVVYGFGGLRINNGEIHLVPSKPNFWNVYSFHLVFRHRLLEVSVGSEQVSVILKWGEPLDIFLFDEKISLKAGIRYKRRHV